MFSLQVLLLVLVLSLPVDSSFSFSFGSRGSRNRNYDFSGPDLTKLYNSGVYKAEKVVRPLGNLKDTYGPISHSGVRVTREDGSQFLIHKGDGYGVSSQTVVVKADHMSSAWKTVSSKDFNGGKTVADFVKAAGETYDICSANCHHAADDMMNQ
ncbi:uncharacterized protein LOC121641292 [Xyrichtys novacula]|uniref:Uncharacterized protein LOC121641292 n=1 Tax=Xyrichtys novacula TaxID=13765 RepID=A0AAV1FM13_XYRNO|nr:uncharacterized protein LOC121641292 [Xyrichtys novacula]